MQFVPHQYPNVKPYQGAFEFDRPALARLLAYCEQRSYPAKRNVFVPGDKADLLYFVISGSLMIVSGDEQEDDGSGNETLPVAKAALTSIRPSSDDDEDEACEDKEKELVVNYIGPGDFIGELGLFYPSHKRNVTLKTRSPSQIAEISYEKLLTLMANELSADGPKILFEIGSQISKRLLSVTRKASGLAFVDVRERVMRAAIELSHNPDALTHPKGMQIKASRQELAKMSGCSREMAGRALKELEEEGRLTAHGKTIVVYGSR